MEIIPIYIETDRLLIKTYTLSDAPVLHQFVKENVFMLYDTGPMTLRNNSSLAGSKTFLEKVEQERLSGKWIWNGIFENENLIGQTTIYHLNTNEKATEFSYFITYQKMGKGFATEAMKALVDYCFKNLNLPKLNLRINPDNIASIRVAEKLGFQKTSIENQRFKTYHGNYIDQDVFELKSSF